MMKLSEWVKGNLNIKPGKNLTLVTDDDVYLIEREAIGDTFDNFYEVRAWFHDIVILKSIPAAGKPFEWEGDLDGLDD